MSIFDDPYFRATSSTSRRLSAINNYNREVNRYIRNERSRIINCTEGTAAEKSARVTEMYNEANLQREIIIRLLERM